MNMKKVLLRSSLGVAIACLTAGALIAQQPPQTPPNPAPAAQQRADDARGQMVTVTGCLKEEKDVPGVKPNIAERAGVGEDFVLIQAKITKGGSSSATDRPDPSASPSGGRTTAASGAMFNITGLDDEKLRAHANKQVEVQGQLMDKTLTGAQKPSTPGSTTDADDLKEIRVTSIKQVAGACKAGTE
jgi:hypothetical protein